MKTSTGAIKKMKEKKLSVEYPAYDEIIENRHLCLECNLSALLGYYGKKFALPLCECLDFEYRGKRNARVSDCLQPVGEIAKAYNLYGLKLHKKTVKSWKEHREFLRNSVDRGVPVIVHFDCYYLAWDPFYRKEHNNHTLLIAGYDEKGFLLVDPYFRKSGRADDVILEAASQFRYEADGLENFDFAVGHREALLKKEAGLREKDYFRNFGLLAKGLAKMSPEKEFFVTDEINIFYHSQLMTKLSRILTNRYRFCLFLKEWEQTDGGAYCQRFKNVLAGWQVFKALLLKAYHARFSAESLKHAAEYLLKIESLERDFLQEILQSGAKEAPVRKNAGGEKTRRSRLNILPYCNNKGLSEKPDEGIADCTGAGEYICTENHQEAVKRRGHRLLVGEKTDNIVCRGQEIELPKDKNIVKIQLLSAAEWGDFEVSFRVDYEDGAAAYFPFTIEDWAVKKTGRISLGATYCIREGDDERFRENAYGEELVLPVNGNVRKLVLPVCPNVHIFSVLLFIGAESGEEKREKAEKKKNG